MHAARPAVLLCNILSRLSLSYAQVRSILLAGGRYKDTDTQSDKRRSTRLPYAFEIRQGGHPSAAALGAASALQIDRYGALGME